MDGSICLDILQHRWSASLDVSTLLVSIRSLLTDPNPASPANSEAAMLYQNHRRDYERRVRECIDQQQIRRIVFQQLHRHLLLLLVTSHCLLFDLSFHCVLYFSNSVSVCMYLCIYAYVSRFVCYEIPISVV